MTCSAVCLLSNGLIRRFTCLNCSKFHTEPSFTQCGRSPREFLLLFYHLVDQIVNENWWGHKYNSRGNINRFRWRHWFGDKMENRKWGICKYYKISIFLCNPVNLTKYGFTINPNCRLNFKPKPLFWSQEENMRCHEICLEKGVHLKKVCLWKMALTMFVWLQI